MGLGKRVSANHYNMGYLEVLLRLITRDLKIKINTLKMPIQKALLVPFF